MIFRKFRTIFRLNSILILAIFFNLGSCTHKEQKSTSENEIREAVLTAYTDLYNSYGEGTDDFFNHYENDFVRVTSKGELKRGVEKPKLEWKDYLKTHTVYLKHFSEPELIIGDDQVVTIGDYVEYFIDNETRDSTYNRGMYIATWRKQEDGAWKISMDTWHAGLKEE